MAGKSKATRNVASPLSALAGRLSGGRVLSESAPNLKCPCESCTRGVRCVSSWGHLSTDFGYVQIHRIGCLAVVIRPYAGDSAGTSGAELVALARLEPVIGAHGEREWSITNINMCGNDDIGDDDAADIAADAFSAADADHAAEFARAARAYAEAR